MGREGIKSLNAPSRGVMGTLPLTAEHSGRVPCVRDGPTVFSVRAEWILSWASLACYSCGLRLCGEQRGPHPNGGKLKGGASIFINSNKNWGVFFLFFFNKLSGLGTIWSEIKKNIYIRSYKFHVWVSHSIEFWTT